MRAHTINQRKKNVKTKNDLKTCKWLYKTLMRAIPTLNQNKILFNLLKIEKGSAEFPSLHSYLGSFIGKRGSSTQFYPNRSTSIVDLFK